MICISLYKETGMKCSYFENIGSGKVRCTLCPHRCQIGMDNGGLCSVRFNDNGVLTSEAYGVVSALSSDPVEKKPLYHFFPGMNIFSVGSYGCNLTCSFCQNHDISQVNQLSGVRSAKSTTVEHIIRSAIRAPNNCGIAFTYNEPVVWIEFMMDISVVAVDYGLNTAMITNGYINPGPLDDLLPLIDAFNVDLKAFNNSFYKKYTGATLKPVLNTISKIASKGKHLEITMLIIEGLNDNQGEFGEAVKWISENSGRETPLHLSRYFPRYRMNVPSTPEETLLNLWEIASEHLDYVYLGNTHRSIGQNTHCPDCGSLVTVRKGYDASHLNTGSAGQCNECGKVIYKNFKPLLSH